jgi:hypothetical protein
MLAMAAEFVGETASIAGVVGEEAGVTVVVIGEELEG